MHDDHVRPQKLLAAGDPLAQRHPVVDDELEVEVGDPNTGVAGARGRLADVATAPAEPEVAAFDGIEQERTVELVGRRVHERGVALELREPERRTQGGDDGADEVGQDVVRVIELDARELSRVAGDVGDQEADGLGLEHGTLSIAS